MAMAKDMGVIGQGREKTRRENPWKIMWSAKMSKFKKKPYKRIAQEWQM
jgi:hypothetical protein